MTRDEFIEKHEIIKKYYSEEKIVFELGKKDTSTIVLKNSLGTEQIIKYTVNANKTTKEQITDKAKKSIYNMFYWQ